jgi:hypothetical protein
MNGKHCIKVKLKINVNIIVMMKTAEEMLSIYLLVEIMVHLKEIPPGNYTLCSVFAG